MKRSITAAILLCASSIAGAAHAATDLHADSGAARLQAQLRSEISRLYPGARVDLTSAVRWAGGAAPEDFQTVSVIVENAPGEAQFAARDASGLTLAQGWVGFAAWMPARIATRRVHPGEKLSAEMFVRQDINVAVGQAHEYRGILLPLETGVASLETRQTVLEGQPLLSSAVERIPDVRRGDSVRIQITSNGLVLSTMGTAQEPAYLNGPVHVLTGKNKRELMGELQSGGVVEVKL